MSPLADPVAVLCVSAEQERGFVVRRHLLLDGSGSEDPQRVARAMVGLHAARLTSPWVAMRARVATFESEQLRSRLVGERSLVKLRCMRRTLHVLPLDLAAVAHAATLDQRAGTCRATLRRLGHSERALLAVTRRVRERLAGRTEPYRALERAIVSASPPRDAALVRLAIRWLWEHGELVYLDLSPSLHHERRYFALTAEAVPGLRLNATGVQAARDALVMAHVRAFGPVSVRDVAWWSGMGTVHVRNALSRHRDMLAAVRVEGLAPDLVVHVDDLADLTSAAPVPSDHVSLLGYEDPALKGYFETRARFVSAEGYRLLFNTIGEARASVMVGGRVVGVWRWDRRRRAIESQVFERLSPRVRRTLAERLGDMESFLQREALSATS
ncbi:MAG: DNA glycosylase AlkZ-like family protein [Solirubrobacteraceae bacterium]